MGNISLDGSKLHADASKSRAVSHGRLQKLEEQLRQKVAELLALGEQADTRELPLAHTPAPPPDHASPIVKMAYKLQPEIGTAICSLRKCTVEPVIGIIKEVLGFR